MDTTFGLAPVVPSINGNAHSPGLGAGAGYAAESESESIDSGAQPRGQLLLRTFCLVWCAQLIITILRTSTQGGKEVEIDLLSRGRSQSHE